MLDSTQEETKEKIDDKTMVPGYQDILDEPPMV